VFSISKTSTECVNVLVLKDYLLVFNDSLLEHQTYTVCLCQCIFVCVCVCVCEWVDGWVGVCLSTIQGYCSAAEYQAGYIVFT